MLERQLWIAVMRAQRELGIDVPDGAIEAYESVVDQVDLASIDARERVTRHDVKARIEEFSALAGHEHVHKGDDLARPDRERRAAPGAHVRWCWCATGWSPRWPGWPSGPPSTPTLVMTGRSHNVAAQATTLGKRFANAGEELLRRVRAGRRPARPLPAAGPQGPGRHPAGPARPARRRRRARSTVWRPPSPPTSASSASLTNVGQVYPRSLDLDVVSGAGAGGGRARQSWPPPSA